MVAHKEAKINGDTLVTLCGATRILFATSSFAKLSMQADRTFVEFGFDRNMRNTTSKTMNFRNTPGMKMS